MSKLKLGKNYTFNGYDCTLVGIDSGVISTSILLKFNCQHPYSGSPYDTYKNLEYDTINYDGIACPFDLFNDDLHRLIPKEYKIRPNKLTKILYPHVKEKDGFLIVEDQ